MSHQSKQSGNSKEQKNQAARNANQANRPSDALSGDKKLDGPNRPAT